MVLNCPWDQIQYCALVFSLFSWTLVCFIQKLKDSRQGRLWYYHIKGFFFWTKFGIVNGALAEQNFDEATTEEPLSIRHATDVYSSTCSINGRFIYSYSTKIGAYVCNDLYWADRLVGAMIILSIIKHSFHVCFQCCWLAGKLVRKMSFCNFSVQGKNCNKTRIFPEDEP